MGEGAARRVWVLDKDDERFRSLWGRAEDEFGDDLLAVASMIDRNARAVGERTAGDSDRRHLRPWRRSRDQLGSGASGGEERGGRKSRNEVGSHVQSGGKTRSKVCAAP